MTFGCRNCTTYPVSLNLLQLNGGRKSYGIQHLFEDASFAINEGDHVGVIGPNGAGKTTLFKILLEEEELDAGQVIRSQQLRIGYLSQHDHWTAEDTGNSYLERVCRSPVWQAKAAGKELQVTEAVFAKPLMSLSGGYRMRIKLIGLLGMDPNLMLLDEPTNYLDLETTLLLERFLQNYEGAFLLISHDREVLRRTTDHTLEVEGGEITKYNGNIDDYFEQKELLRSQLAAQAQNQALKRKMVMDFVSRFGAKATKAKQAQSKLRGLEKMETIELKPVPVRAAIQIPAPPPVGKTVLQMEQVALGYNGHAVIEDVNLEIKRGDHVAVVGFNGAGKSTLLKGIAGTLAPMNGKRVLGHQVELAIFNQHVVEVLDPNHTVFESLESVVGTQTTAQEIRNMAGSLLFSSDQITKRIRVLSGGEKSRVALGRILLQKVPCLLLDEPTNHLDFQTVEALTQALHKFAGTVIVVSHDRGFVKRIGTKILEVKKHQVHLYPGTYDEYVWSLQKRLATEDSSEGSSEADRDSARAPGKSVTTGKSQGNASLSSQAESGSGPSSVAKPNHKDQAKKIRQLERTVENAQKRIEQLEKENAALNATLTSGAATSAAVMELTAKMTANYELIQKHENEWLDATQELGLLQS